MTSAFALVLEYLSMSTRRLEVFTPKAIHLFPNGQVQINAHFGRGQHPEVLALNWWRPAEQPTFHAIAARGTGMPSQVPRLNGVLRDTGALTAGDLLTWHGFSVSVVSLETLEAPERPMVDAARSSDAALQVFADWLETNGASHRAEWTRLVLASPEDPARAQRMEELASSLGPSFRAQVARGRIERCTRAGCPSRWEALPLRAEPWLRPCATCERTVTWCPDADTARDLPGPVTLDPATPRRAGDLLPRPPVVG